MNTSTPFGHVSGPSGFSLCPKSDRLQPIGANGECRSCGNTPS